MIDRVARPAAMGGARIALIAGLLGATAACGAIPLPLPGKSDNQATPAAVATPGPGAAVGTTPARQGRIATTLTYSGIVSSVQQTNLLPKVAGRIERIFVDVGDQVTRGQTLIQLDRGTLDTAIQQAEANVRSAQARVSTVRAGARPEEIESARAQLNAARARLAGMEAGGRAEDIGSAQAAVESAQARIEQVRNQIKEADVRTAEQSLKAAQATFDSAVTNLNKLRTPNQDELSAARTLVEKSFAALQQAQAAYDRVAWRPDIAGRPESVQLQSATLDYQNALAQLRLREQPRQSELDAAQKQVDAARAQLEAAKARLDQLRAGPAAEDLRVAEAALSQALQNLAKSRQPNSATDLEQQRQQVVQAEQSLALRSNPYTANDIETAEAQLAQAQAQLAAARTQAQEGVVVAPYDGIITARLLGEGALVGTGTPALTIASLDVEVLVNVEESRINQIQPGQSATIAVSSSSGATFAARVASIAPSADQRTHTFVVKVRPEPQDARLRAGMLADVRITVAERASAVLVPRDALVQKDGRTVIFVVDGSRVREVTVGAGIASDGQVEVPAGVRPGDQVVVVGQAALNDGDAVRPSEIPPTPTPASPAPGLTPLAIPTATPAGPPLPSPTRA